MLRGLFSAASGMIGQQTMIDNIANNLANVNTTGYKKGRLEFHDLIYETVRQGESSAQSRIVGEVGVRHKGLWHG